MKFLTTYILILNLNSKSNLILEHLKEIIF